MVTSLLEVLVDFGSDPDENVLNRTLNELKSQKDVKEAKFKDGAIVVETTLQSNEILDLVKKSSGKRAVLQGFGDAQSAVSMITSPNVGNIKGVVRFQQKDDLLVAEGTIDGLATGQHGLHVYECGDLSQGCKNIGNHFNPYQTSHGGPQDELRHAGDLGNIIADEQGRANFRIIDGVLKIWDIIGRSVAVTDRADDLGKGKTPESKVDGNSGTPIACGIIARSSGIFQNPKRICACDGVVVWDEKDRPLVGKGRRVKNCCGKEKGDEKPCCKV